MPQRIFTSDELINFVRRQGRIPNKAVTGGQDQDILQLLNEALYSIIVPVFRKSNEGYFEFTQRIAVPAGAQRVPIPTRAVGRQVRDVCYYDGTERQRIQVLPRERLTDFSSESTTQPAALYVEGNDLVFVENYTGGNFLDVTFYALPGQLVLLAEGRKITGVDTAAKQLTVDSAVPQAWVDEPKTFDIHGPLSGGELRMMGVVKDSADNLTITIQDAIDGSTYGTSKPAVGDYICLEREAVIPAIPIEWHIPLGWAALMMWHQSQGNLEQMTACKETLGELVQNEKGILKPRVQSHPKKFIQRNPLWHGTGSVGGGW